MNKHILIVDDDKEIANLIEIYLANDGYEVTKAHNGLEALEELGKSEYHLVVLDVMMPKLDGLEVCRQIRSKKNIPILMLSAKGEDMDKILGLTTGADDYMVKPFNPLELLARVKSLFRRSFELNAKSSGSDEAITIRSVQINKSTHTVTVDGRGVNLTSIEFDILYLLASHPGRVFSAEEIFEKVWKEKYYQSHNTVMVHISKLRDKLESESGESRMIQTVWGVGYKIDP